MAEATLIEAMAKGIYEADREGGYDAEDPKTFWMAADGYWPPSTKMYVWDLWLGAARAAISAAEESGYAIVPREPTDAMYEAASREDGFYERWLAMLAASEHERRPAGEE